jgi:hypothetical protein
MSLIDEFAFIANSSAFVFTAEIGGEDTAGDTATATDERTVTAVVRDVLKAPDGMRGLAGREVTVHLSDRLPEGRYVLFANPVSVGSSIAVRETAHLDEGQRGDAEAAIERGYAEGLRPRLEAARLVALGTIGDVTPLFPPAERRGGVPWALARFGVEQVLKGPRSRRRLTLIGPSPASKHLPRAPALRAGVRAILLLQRPPEDAIEHIPKGERQAAGFIAETSDIQPPERVEDLVRILGDEGRG